MPNIITHTLFSDEVFEVLVNEQNDVLSGRLALVEAGANGPDFLFFHGLSYKHFLKNSSLRKLGSLAHEDHINDFYLSALQSIRKEADPQIKKDMIAYCIGHLCHWALDSTVHPYVFYRTGNCKGKSAWWHHRFESLLDAIVLKVKKELTIKDYKAYSICDLSLEQVRAIARIYVPAANNVFHIPVTGHEILESIQDWKTMQRVFYDASGKKVEMLQKLEGVLGVQSLFSGYLVPNTPIDPFDVTNLLHKVWLHPCDKTLASTESFFDLYERAKILALDSIRLFIHAISDQDLEQVLASKLADRNYDMGIKYGYTMKYFDPVQDHPIYDR